MKAQFFLIASLITGSLAFAADSKPSRSMDMAPAFERLKSLVGEWQADNGKSHLSYELVSGGTALIERESSETMAPMVTVYHLDGGRPVLTHYCMVGNQPRMRAKSFDPNTGELDFQFLDATNLANPSDGHMHNMKIRFADNDHVATEWQFYENGKVKFSENTQYTRVR